MSFDSLGLVLGIFLFGAALAGSIATLLLMWLF